MKLIFIPLLALVTCSCDQTLPSSKIQTAAPATPLPVSAHKASEPKISAIRIRRSTCFGSCPAYELEISANGKVKFVGDKFVDQTGFHTSQIDPSAFTQIEARVRAIKFFELRESYRYEPDGCTSWATDNPTVAIIVSAGDSEKSVSYYFGCRGLPVGPQLISLADLVDNLGDSKKWIGHNGGAI